MNCIKLYGLYGIQHLELYDLIIIGGGPGGIGAAVEAKLFGIKKVLLIEKSDNHSDTIRRFYKDRKRVDKDWQGRSVDLIGNIKFTDGTKESTLDYFDRLLKEHKIDSRFNCEVLEVKKEGDVFKVWSACENEPFLGKNVIVAIGRMGKPNKPSYKIPPSLRKVVNFNLDKCSKGEKILVVGGGDSAVEYAYDLGSANDVTLNYRRDKITRANPYNLSLIEKAFKENKIKPKLGVNIENIEDKDGKVKVNFKNKESEIYDRVIYAIGGTTPVDFLKKCSIELDEKKRPLFDENYETKIKGLYITGDIAFDSGGSIAMALNQGYKIVKHILGVE